MALVNFIIPIVTLILLVIFKLFYSKKTRTGMAMRALSKDYEAASLNGNRY